MLTDSMWMLVTNISDTTEPEEFRFSPEKLISAYRDKNRVWSETYHYIIVTYIRKIKRKNKDE